MLHDRLLPLAEHHLFVYVLKRVFVPRRVYDQNTRRFKLHLSLKEKYDLIIAHEERFAYRLGMEIIQKPEVSVWMILIPLLFLHHIYKINQYKTDIRSFAQKMMIPKKKALDKAYDEASAGRKIPYQVRDYFPGLDLNSEQDKILAEKQVRVIQVMEAHYLALLKTSGRSFEEIFKNVYRSRSRYRNYLSNLEKNEKALNDFIKKNIHTSVESRQVIKEIEKSCRRLRQEELNRLP